MALLTEQDHAHVAEIAQHYDAAANTYDSGYSSPLNKAEDQKVVELIEPILQGNVLDVGCGTGIVLDYFGDRLNSNNYIGFDVSSKMLEKAHQKFPGYVFLQADMEHLPIASDSQDTILSTFGPLSYSLHPKQTICEFLRVLKPGGWIAVMPYSLRVGCGVGVESYSTATKQDIPKIYYTSDSLKDLFAPFENVQLHGINYVGNFVEEMTTIMPVTPLTLEEYMKVIAQDELFAQILPVEYARHIMVIAQKAL